MGKTISLSKRRSVIKSSRPTYVKKNRKFNPRKTANAFKKFV